MHQSYRFIHSKIIYLTLLCLAPISLAAMDQPVKKAKWTMDQPAKSKQSRTRLKETTTRFKASAKQIQPIPQQKVLIAAPKEPCTLFATPNDNVIGSIALDIKSTGADGYIGIESPHLSSRIIIHELREAAQRGARVRVFTDADSATNLNAQLAGTTIEITTIPNLHAKRTVIKADLKKIVWLGSMNMSEHATENHEIMMRCTDQDSFKESFGDQQRLGQDFYDHPTPTVDFRTRRIINSSTPEAQSAIKRVIAEFSACSHPHDYLYFVAYTLEDPEIVHALIVAKNQTSRPITVLLDGQNWTNQRLRSNTLKPLVDAGVYVYIFNKNEDKKTVLRHNKLMHIKAIIRQCDQKCLSLISTANFTPTGKQEINHDLWETCSLGFSGRLKKILDTIINESIQLTPKDFPIEQTMREKKQRLLEIMKYPDRMHPNKDEIIRLIKDGINPDMLDEYGGTPLMKAVASHQPEIAATLIAAGANINFSDEYGGTALQSAAARGDTDMVYMLLNAGAEIDYADIFGNTALFKAISAGHIKTVKLLIAFGADMEKGGDYREYGFRKEFKGTLPPIAEAVRRNHFELAQALLAAGAHVDAKDREGLTALWHAYKNHDSKMIALLAKAGANLNILNPSNGETPLINAVKNNDLELVNALLNAGADLNTKDNMGKTASYYAKDSKMIELINSVKLLRENLELIE